MEIQKRSMNWLPKPSLYAANEAARIKRRAYARNDISLASNLANTLISAQSTTSSEQIALAIKVAAARIQASSDAKLKAAAASLSKTA
jgi:hypothetical protein